MNKKVINATSVSYDGINFKSKFEASIYKMLKESELKFSYEDYTITLMEGFYPTKTQKLDTVPPSQAKTQNLPSQFKNKTLMSSLPSPVKLKQKNQCSLHISKEL